jgi:hypothetical protein
MTDSWSHVCVCVWGAIQSKVVTEVIHFLTFTCEVYSAGLSLFSATFTSAEHSPSARNVHVDDKHGLISNGKSLELNFSL